MIWSIPDGWFDKYHVLKPDGVSEEGNNEIFFLNLTCFLIKLIKHMGLGLLYKTLHLVVNENSDSRDAVHLRYWEGCHTKAAET